MKKPWVTWLLVYLGLFAAWLALYFIAPISGAPGLVRAAGTVVNVIATAWLYYGLWC